MSEERTLGGFEISFQCFTALLTAHGVEHCAGPNIENAGSNVVLGALCVALSDRCHVQGILI